MYSFARLYIWKDETRSRLVLPPGVCWMMVMILAFWNACEMKPNETWATCHKSRKHLKREQNPLERSKNL